MSTKESINYWEMDDASLAESYRNITSPFVNDEGGENAETLAFIEDAICQRIGLDDTDDPADPAVNAQIQGFVRGVKARADYEAIA